MSNFSRGLLAATLTSSLAFAGATTASAEEAATTNCGSPKAEFTATVDGKEHTFKKVSEFLWQATDDEKVELNRAEIFDLAKAGEDVCNSEPIDIDDESDGNTGGGDDADNDDESDGNTGGGDDADNDDESEGGGDDADNDDESEGGDDDESDDNTGGDDDADNDDESEGDDDESEGDKDKNKDKSSFDGIKDALSSEDGKPTDLGIAAIVIGVLGALAAIIPNAARALGIKLPF